MADDTSGVVREGPTARRTPIPGARQMIFSDLGKGHTALFTTTGQLLCDLCALDSGSALRRPRPRIRHRQPANPPLTRSTMSADIAAVIQLNRPVAPASMPAGGARRRLRAFPDRR